MSLHCARPVPKGCWAAVSLTACMPDMPQFDFYLSGVSGGEGAAVVVCERTCSLLPAALSSSWRCRSFPSSRCRSDRCIHFILNKQGERKALGVTFLFPGDQMSKLNLDLHG